MNNYDEILENYKKIFNEQTPEEAEKYLADQDVDVTDLPEELADGIRNFLESLQEVKIRLADDITTSGPEVKE